MKAAPGLPKASSSPCWWLMVFYSIASLSVGILLQRCGVLESSEIVPLMPGGEGYPGREDEGGSLPRDKPIKGVCVRVCVCVCVWMSVCLSSRLLWLQNLAQIYTVSAETRTLLFLLEQQPNNRIVCVCVHLIPNSSGMLSNWLSVDATINERTLTRILFMVTEDLRSIFHLVAD